MGRDWLFLATAVGPDMRMVVGRAPSGRMAAVVVEALERAWRRGHVAKNAISRSVLIFTRN